MDKPGPTGSTGPQRRCQQPEAGAAAAPLISMELPGSGEPAGVLALGAAGAHRGHWPSHGSCQTRGPAGVPWCPGCCRRPGACRRYRLHRNFQTLPGLRVLLEPRDLRAYRAARESRGATGEPQTSRHLSKRNVSYFFSTISVMGLIFSASSAL